MKVSGFTFIRNGVAFGYPFVASIRSALPLVDEFIVVVGRSDDATLACVQAIADPKIRIIESTWNEAMTDRGFVYAQQKMIGHYNCSGDWALYLEGDEVLHEKDIPTIRRAMEKHLANPAIEALAFDYIHLYGTPRHQATGPGWYRREVRIIRNSIRSWAPDGLFFVIMDGSRRGHYPAAAMTGATIYHYGHVRPSAVMRERLLRVSKYWGETTPATDFTRYADVDARIIRPYAGSHPALIADWIESDAEHEFTPNPDYRPNAKERRRYRLMQLENLLGLDLSKKHFKLVKQ